MSIVYHSQYPQLVGVSAVKHLAGFAVRITFTDGTERDINLEPHLRGPVFEPIRCDPQLFASVFVDPVGQTLAWSNGADIAPETLYYEGDPPWANAVDKAPRPQLRRTPRPSRARRAAGRRRTKRLTARKMPEATQ